MESLLIKNNKEFNGTLNSLNLTLNYLFIFRNRIKIMRLTLDITLYKIAKMRYTFISSILAFTNIICFNGLVMHNMAVYWFIITLFRKLSLIHYEKYYLHS